MAARDVVRRKGNQAVHDLLEQRDRCGSDVEAIWERVRNLYRKALEAETAPRHLHQFAISCSVSVMGRMCYPLQ